jgi:aerobic carbon-monoxide dehydrogenase small subunit
VPEVRIRFTVNHEPREVETYPMKRLLDVLREDLHLTGTKEGCGEGECGACSIMLDGRLVNSCLIPILQAEGAAIQTIEGVSDINNPSKLHPIQQAFIQHGASQCGICTPGMVMAALELLNTHPNPTDEQIRTGLAGNICRCTGYMRIFEAIAKAVEP